MGKPCMKLNQLFVYICICISSCLSLTANWACNETQGIPTSVMYMYYVCPSDNQLASGPVFRPLDHFLQSLDCIVWKTTPGVIFQSNINYCNLINYNWS